LGRERKRVNLLFVVPTHATHQIQALMEEACHLLEVPALAQGGSASGRGKKEILLGLIDDSVAAVFKAAGRVTSFHDAVLAPVPDCAGPADPLAVIVSL